MRAVLVPLRRWALQQCGHAALLSLLLPLWLLLLQFLLSFLLHYPRAHSLVPVYNKSKGECTCRYACVCARVCVCVLVEKPNIIKIKASVVYVCVDVDVAAAVVLKRNRQKGAEHFVLRPALCPLLSVCVCVLLLLFMRFHYCFRLLSARRRCAHSESRVALW